MKYKVFGISAMVLLVLCAFLAQEVQPPRNRYHQHLQAETKKDCTAHGNEVFCTHLPLLHITTDAPMPDPYLSDDNGEILCAENGLAIKNNEMVSATVQYFDDATQNNHLTDAPTVESRALIRIRGNSSRAYDKTGYLLKFKQDDLLENRDISLSGMTADSDWVLHGPFLDKSLLRNYLCYNLAGEIMAYAPNVRFCELFLNDEYRGVYLIVERVGYHSDGRINITKSDPTLVTTSYILQVDSGTDDPTHALHTLFDYTGFTATAQARNGQLEIVYPRDSLTEQQRQFIESDFSKFEKALSLFNNQHHQKGYQQYMDVDSFVDFFLINEFTLNYDAVNLSTYLYKDIGGKITLCVWDFNSAFDYYQESVVTPETFRLHTRLWYQYLFRDKAFVEQVVNRYHTLRKTVFNEAYLSSYIDEVVAYLGSAVERNFERWGYSFQSTHQGVNYDYLIPAERNVRSYAEAIAQIKQTISQRIAYMDNNLERLYFLCHESMNKQEAS